MSPKKTHRNAKTKLVFAKKKKIKFSVVLTACWHVRTKGRRIKIGGIYTDY